MKRDRNRNLFALCFVLLLVGGGALALSGAQHEPADFTFINSTEPESLDPAIVTGVPEGRVLRAVYEGLVVQDAKTLEPLPGMAESWEISPDGKTYVFHIRRGMTWSDGSPFTAEDLRWSWERFLKPETAAEYAYLLWYVDGAEAFTKGKEKDFSKVGIEVRDPHTFVVRLAEPTPFFIDLMAFYCMYPIHRATVEKHPETWHHPDKLVCNGPFKLKERWIRDRIRLVKNERYWDAENVALNTVDILPVESQVTMLNLYLTGAADWITDVPNQVVQDLVKREDFKPVPYLGIYYYMVNLTNKDPERRRFLANPKARRALFLAMDRAAIVKGVTKAGEVAATSFVPPGIRGYASPETPAYDPDAAKKLMDEALAELDMEKAPRFTILYNSHELHKDVAEVIQQQWSKALGIEVRLENQEWQSYLKSRRTGDYDVSRSAWIGDYNDPNTFLDLWVTGGGNNHSRYANAEYDALLASALREPNRARRMEIYAQAEAILLRDLPILPIYYYVTKNMVRPWVKGLHPNLQDVHFLKFVSIDAGVKAAQRAK